MSSSLETKNAEPTKNNQSSSIRSPSKIVKAAGMIFGNLENVDFDPKIDCPPHACYNCWSFDHLRKNCPEEKSSRLYCCNCGRKDVQVNECARCSKAFFELDMGLRKWVRCTFLNSKHMKDEDNKIRQTKKTVVDMNLDEDEFQSFHTCGYGMGKDVVEDDVNIDWESRSHYVQPNHLFAYMRAKKTKEEFESDQINNIDVNLDETRMADRDSFGENSVVSIEDFTKKDDEVSQRSTAGEPLSDFLKLLDAVKHLSVDTQEVVILQFMSERKKLVEMQNKDERKLPLFI